MGKPYGDSFRADILGTFDANPIQGIQEVVNTLKDNEELDYLPSYNAVRRMIQKMANEGTLQELPNRGPKNKAYYTKAFFRNITRFADQGGNNVSLKEFIHKLIETDGDPEIINPAAMVAIKMWMLDSLGAALPQNYEALNKAVPVPVELRANLEEVLRMLKTFHAFIKQFVDADIWTPVAQERLVREFESTCVEEHAMIVDRSWRQ